jgi:hypothetical protein
LEKDNASSVPYGSGKCIEAKEVSIRSAKPFVEIRISESETSSLNKIGGI